MESLSETVAAQLAAQASQAAREQPAYALGRLPDDCSASGRRQPRAEAQRQHGALERRQPVERRSEAWAQRGLISRVPLGGFEGYRAMSGPQKREPQCSTVRAAGAPRRANLAEGRFSDPLGSRARAEVEREVAIDVGQLVRQGVPALAPPCAHRASLPSTGRPSHPAP